MRKKKSNHSHNSVTRTNIQSPSKCQTKQVCFECMERCSFSDSLDPDHGGLQRLELAPMLTTNILQVLQVSLKLGYKEFSKII